MKLSTSIFKGELPRISQRALPDGNAVTALNCRLLSADLDGWKNFQDEASLCSNGSPINAIYLLDDQYWLKFTDSQLASGADSVDIAKGIIPGDTTARTYLTGMDAPRFTNISLTTTPVTSDGSGWTAATTPPKPTNGSSIGTAFGGSLCSFGGNLYSIGGANNSWSSYSIYKSADNGASWTTQTATQPWSNPTEGSMGPQACANSTYMFFFNKNSSTGFYECWRTSDASSWSRAQANITSGASNKFVAGCLAIGSNLFLFLGLQASGGGVYLSADNGATWTAKNTTATFLARTGYRVGYIGTTLYAIGGYDGTTIYHDVWSSTDNGATWTQVTAAASFSARWSHCVLSYGSALWVIAGAANSAHSSVLHDVWTSTDGSTWTEATAAAAFSARFEASHCVHANTMYIGPGGSSAVIVDGLYYASGATPPSEFTCYPISTRLLGVTGPAAAPSVSVSVDPGTPVSYSDTGSNLSAWTLSPQVNTASQIITVTTDNTQGSPSAPSYKLKAFQSIPNDAYMFQDIGTADNTNVSYSVDWTFTRDNASAGAHMRAEFVLCANSGANGVTIIYDQSNGQTVRQANGNTAAVSALPVTWLRLAVNVTRTGDNACSYSFQLTRVDTGAVLDSGAFTGPWNGGYCFFSTHNYADLGNTSGVTFNVDNIQISGAGAWISAATLVSTSYVYTFVNDLGEESAPSDPSATVTAGPSQTKVVTTATSATSGQYVETKRIYRAVTGVTGTSFQFVAEIALATASYSDTLLDSQLGEVLATDNWDPPPSDLRGILALPNGVMAGFSKNELCFSVQNFPHAWPVAYRLSTDYDIVGIGNIDTNVVIVTKTFPYLAAGNDPANYSMSKLELPQGGVSKRSIAYMKGVGVIYASPDGLVAVSGNGGARIITGQMFSRKEWQALNPSSIIATVHDNRYFGFYDDGTNTPAGFAIDEDPDGFGKISLGFHALAAYAHLVTDKLYLLLDENTLPSGVSPSEQIVPTGNTVYSFDSYAGGSPTLTLKLPYQWTSKLYQLPYPTWLMAAQVKALDYSDITLTVYADGSSIFSEAISSSKEFILPTPAKGVARTYQFKIVGTSDVTLLEAAEDMMELE